MLLAVQNHQCERQLCCAPLQCGVQGAIEVQNFPQHCAKVWRIAGGGRQLAMVQGGLGLDGSVCWPVLAGEDGGGRLGSVLTGWTAGH